LDPAPSTYRYLVISSATDDAGHGPAAPALDVTNRPRSTGSAPNSHDFDFKTFANTVNMILSSMQFQLLVFCKFIYNQLRLCAHYLQ
jgi:hypothetical protein